MTKPSSAALQSALQAVLRDAQPPPLVPHPPEKSMAWRTRRIVAELNAQKDVVSLSSFEAELRGVLHSQETRCRTKLMAAAAGEECAIREREAVAADEAVQRCKIANAFLALTQPRFDVLHLNLEEELCRRALRREERDARRDCVLHTRATRLVLNEQSSRAGLYAQEECCREELTFRRVIEIGNELQRDIVAQNRLSGHLRSVAHSRSVQEARQQVEWQEDRDRTAVERLYELHTLLLLQDIKQDFTATIRKDVLQLSEANREVAQEAREESCADELRKCVSQEAQLREMVEQQEASEFRSVAQSFLLGWRSVYKAITRDPDVFSLFGKIELLVRREIADQERREFGALSVAAHNQWSLLLRHRAARRALCQEYVTGAKRVWDEEGRAANALFRLHHQQVREADALHITTVLAAAETAARRSLCGAEAQSRLHLKRAYFSSTLQLTCAQAAQRIAAEEERSFAQLRRRCVDDVRTRQAETLAAAEGVARLAVERAEATAATDVFVLARQALRRSRVADVTRPLVTVEAQFRERVEGEEAEQRGWLSLRCCRFIEHAARWQLANDERDERDAVQILQMCAAETVRREALCHDAEVEEAHLRLMFLAAAAEVQRRDDEGSYRTSCGEEEEGDRGGEDEATRDVEDDNTNASMHLSGEWDLPQCVEPWSDVYAEWDMHDDGTSSTASFESRKISAPLLMSPYAVQCEEVLTDAYMERDRVHFTENAEWRHLLKGFLNPAAADRSGEEISALWKLHSVSLKQEPNQRAASVNVWDSNQNFDVTFPLAQQQEEGIVGERTIAFYYPYAPSTAAVLPRCAADGMVFFLVLDEEGTVLSSATMVLESVGDNSGCLCVALNNSAGYLRFVA